MAGSAPKFARLAQPTLARQRERREYSWRQPSRASPVSQDPVSRPDVRGVPDIAWAALDTPLTQCYDGQGWAAPVPLRYQAAWVEAVRLPLRRILSQERGSALWEQAWRLLHLLPRMLLLAHPREGLPLEDFEDRLRRFWAGDWRSLLPLRPGARIVLPDSDLPDAPGQAHHTWQEGGAGRGGNDWANTSRRVTELLAQGERSRAVRLLTSPGLADRTDASYHRIVAYHPAARRPDQLRELQIGGVTIAGQAAPSAEDCAAHLRRGGQGGAGGPTLWRKAHALPFLNDRAVLTEWALVQSALATGAVPPEVDGVGGWCVLHGLKKASGSQAVRPLGVGEFFRRHIWSSLLRRGRKGHRDFLFGPSPGDGARRPRQFAVGLSSGADMLVHTVRLLLEAQPQLCVVKLDSRNAFNSVCRWAMLRAFRDACPDLFPYAYRLYGGAEAPRLLFGLKDGRVRVVYSKEGTQQGDPAGPLLFCLALHPSLHALQATLGPDVYVLAYLDDIFLLVPHGRVKTSLLAAREALREHCNLELEQSKCVVYDPQAGRPPEPEFQPGQSLASVQWHSGDATGAGVLVVGGPVGNAQFVQQTLHDGPLTSTRTLLATLPRLSTRQEGLVLLRSSAVHKISYHLRVTPPPDAIPAAAEFDSAVGATFARLTGISVRDLASPRPGPLAQPGAAATAPMRQVQLPVRRGGYGLRSQFGLAPLAYLGSLAQCLPIIASAFPELRDAINALAAPEGATLPSLRAAEGALAAIRADGWPARLDAKTPFSWQAVLDRPQGWPKVQRELCRAWERHQALEMMTDASWEPWQATRLRSLQATGNLLLSWTTGAPAGEDSRVEDNLLILVVRWTLGLPLPTGMVVRPCRCGNPAPDVYGRHAANCSHGGGAASSPQHGCERLSAHPR